MSDFQASNGLSIIERPTGLRGIELRDQAGENTLDGFDHLTATEMDALREYLAAQADEGLGRVRWAGNPSIVIYPHGKDAVAILDEREPQIAHYTREDIARLTAMRGEVLSEPGRAAREYFDAHPEPKPWHDAQPGEVWVITTSNVADERAVQVTPQREFLYNDAIDFPQSFPLTYAAIETGRCIWPEARS